jgi:hypothetical protein
VNVGRQQKRSRERQKPGEAEQHKARENAPQKWILGDEYEKAGHLLYLATRIELLKALTAHEKRTLIGDS